MQIIFANYDINFRQELIILPKFNSFGNRWDQNKCISIYPKHFTVYSVTAETLKGGTFSLSYS